MNLTVKELDEHMKFLQTEASRLRSMHSNASWAFDKADKMEKIGGILRDLRSEIQMTGLGGKKIT
jgi:hypothetical protein